VTNALRITVAGALAHRFGAVAAEGFLHEFSGWAIFLSALALMFGCHWVLRRNASLQQAKVSHA
jgi:exosortase/archaeosortase family protein